MSKQLLWVYTYGIISQPMLKILKTTKQNNTRFDSYTTCID